MTLFSVAVIRQIDRVGCRGLMRSDTAVHPQMGPFTERIRRFSWVGSYTGRNHLEVLEKKKKKSTVPAEKNDPHHHKEALKRVYKTLRRH